MAQTYTWDNLIAVTSKLIKGQPTVSIDPQICDFISSEIWTHYPFKESVTVNSAGQITLSDGVQDYSVPSNLLQLTKGSIVRTDVSPNEWRDLNVSGDLAVDLVSRSWLAIRSVSNQRGVGLLRLESAVSVPSGETLELRIEYTINPTKVSATSQPCWFQDHYAPVAVCGMLYWYYKIGDDPRAGTAAMQDDGTMTYSGQLAEFQSALMRMQRAEDFGGIQSLFPESAMGADRDWGGSLNIFGWV